MRERSFTIREYREGDEAAIVSLFERVFAKPMGRSESEQHWRWEYARNPVGPRMIELAWDGDDLVGQYAVSPRRMWCDGKEVLAALTLDAMTHPDYGRQRIFTTSADACYTAMAERGFAFVYGFPNASVVGGFERHLSWNLIMKAPVHVKPIDVGKFVAEKADRMRLAPWLSLGSRMLSRAPGIIANARVRLQSRVAVEVTACSAIEDWADALWNRCRAHHRVWIVRDRAYLNWRYDERPESDYVFLRAEAGGAIVGLAVLAVATREQGRICFVMELLADPTLSAALPTLLAAIEAQARAQNCAFVSAMVSPGSRYRSAFHAHAYLPLPERLFPHELHFGVRRTGDEVNPDLLDPRAWHLTWGDTDLLWNRVTHEDAPRNRGMGSGPGEDGLRGRVLGRARCRCRRVLSAWPRRPGRIRLERDQTRPWLTSYAWFLRKDSPVYDGLRVDLLVPRVLAACVPDPSPRDFEHAMLSSGELDVSHDDPAALAAAVAQWIRASVDPPAPSLAFELD